MINIESNKIKITGCNDCPLCVINDMSSGYSCRIKEHPDNYIKEDRKKFMPITPNWCPIKNNEITITY